MESNSDIREECEKIFKDAGIIYLNDSGVTIEGLKFFGSPVSPHFAGWGFEKTRGTDIKKHWDLIPADTDILITHGPAFGLLDRTLDGTNVGCEDLRERIHEIKPLIDGCGHIHEAYGELESEGTLFINASSLDIFYRCINDPIVVDLKKDKDGKYSYR